MYKVLKEIVEDKESGVSAETSVSWWDFGGNLTYSLIGSSR